MVAKPKTTKLEKAPRFSLVFWELQDLTTEQYLEDVKEQLADYYIENACLVVGECPTCGKDGHSRVKELTFDEVREDTSYTIYKEDTDSREVFELSKQEQNTIVTRVNDYFASTE